MGFSPTGNDGYNSEINVTPLVDVVLVLLIIFMVIVPLTLHGHDVDIPGPAIESGTSSPEPAAEQVVLTISLQDCPAIAAPDGPGLPADCSVWLGDESIAAPELAERTAALFAERDVDDRVLFLSTDGRINYEVVMRIVDDVRAGTPSLRIGIVK